MVTSESLADIEVESNSQDVNWCFKLAFFLFFLRKLPFALQLYCRKTQRLQLYAVFVELPRDVAYFIHVSFWYFILY